jgi:hypothetical protein
VRLAGGWTAVGSVGRGGGESEIAGKYPAISVESSIFIEITGKHPAILSHFAQKPQK